MLWFQFTLFITSYSPSVESSTSYICTLLVGWKLRCIHFRVPFPSCSRPALSYPIIYLFAYFLPISHFQTAIAFFSICIFPLPLLPISLRYRSNGTCPTLYMRQPIFIPFQRAILLCNNVAFAETFHIQCHYFVNTIAKVAHSSPLHK